MGGVAKSFGTLAAPYVPQSTSLRWRHWRGKVGVELGAGLGISAQVADSKEIWRRVGLGYLARLGVPDQDSIGSAANPAERP